MNTYFEPTWLTAARAQAIWEAKGPFGDFTGACTAHENHEIFRVWKTMHGGASWADALLSIAQGRHELTPASEEDKP